MQRFKHIRIYKEDDCRLVGYVQFLIKKLNPQVKNIKFTRAMLMREILDFIEQEGEKHGFKRKDYCYKQ